MCGWEAEKAKDSVQLSLLTGTRTEFGSNYISIIDNVRTKSSKTILKKKLLLNFKYDLVQELNEIDNICEHLVTIQDFYDVFATYSLIRRKHLFSKLTFFESIIVCFFYAFFTNWLSDIRHFFILSPRNKI